MWEYNYEYLAHGVKGFKYIDRTWKNGKWVYTYPNTVTHPGIVGNSTAFEDKANSLRKSPGESVKVLVGQTPGRRAKELSKPTTRASKAAQQPTTSGVKQLQNIAKKVGSNLSDQAKNAYNKTLGSDEFKEYQRRNPKFPVPKEEKTDLVDMAKKVGSNLSNQAKGAYDKTLGSEDFKKYKEYKPKRNDVLRNLRDTIWNAARAKNDQERQQNIAALKQILNTAESKYGSTAAKEIWKEYEDTIDKYYGFATDAADKYELESSYKALNDFKNVDREVKNQKVGTTEAGFDAEMERWVQRSKKKK